jgi:hypothetical protein
MADRASLVQPLSFAIDKKLETAALKKESKMAERPQT